MMVTMAMPVVAPSPMAAVMPAPMAMAPAPVMTASPVMTVSVSPAHLLRLKMAGLFRRSDRRLGIAGTRELCGFRKRLQNKRCGAACGCKCRRSGSNTESEF